MREEKAIELIRNKDPDGLKFLMDRYIPYISAIVWNILRSAMTVQDAEEVVSDVFLAAWNQSEDLQPGKAKAWLGAVARNKAKNALRDAGHDLPLEEDVLELPDDSALKKWSGRRKPSWCGRQWTACHPKIGRFFCATIITLSPSPRFPGK